MSPHLYRRLMRDKLARLRHRAATHEPHDDTHGVSMLTLNQLSAVRPATRGREKPCHDHHHHLPGAGSQDHRRSDEYAEWNPATDALRVVVVDRESATVTFAVRADASEAFVHRSSMPTPRLEVA